jgi:hypothetical protein
VARGAFSRRDYRVPAGARSSDVFVLGYGFV